MKYYRGYKQAMGDLKLKRSHWDYEQEMMWKKGINLSMQFAKKETKAVPENVQKKDVKNAEKAIPRPGYGKHDLDTGLTLDQKRQLVLKVRPQTAQ